MNRQPNFLYIIADQLRADYLGCYGHPLLKTPHIDALAQTGTRFDNFYAASPVCMPNRATLLTGRYPSVHGLRKNGLHLPAGSVTFADVLRHAGYDTAMIGKSHVQPFTGRNLPMENPYQGAPIKEAVAQLEDDWAQEDPARWRGEEPYQVNTPYYGFNQVDMVSLHGDNCGGHYYQWLRRQVGSPEAICGPENQLPHDYICPQAFRTALPEELHPTSYIRNRTIDYLKDEERKNQPFFAFVSFPDPHHPFAPPGKYWDMYDPDDFTVVAPFEDHKNPPPHLQFIREQYLQGKRIDTSEKAFMANDREIREAMALTCGMITMIDDAVGTIMDTLRAQGLDDNTIVIFNSDHGDYLGDYSLLLKGPEPSRNITRVPFIWREPNGREPASSEAITSMIDIAPTILDRAGLQPFNGIQGSSLLPLLNGSQASLRDGVLIEYEDNIAHWSFDQPSLSRTLMTAQYRLTLFLNQPWGELYDLQRDPHELHNLWSEADYATIRLQLTETLLQQVMAAGETSPWPKRLA